MKISIVIPVYNGEMFLRETLSSVEGQSFRDFECLCINDGGRDGSAAIINELAKRDDRFVFIDKSNKGVAATRNLGIEHARGEFVTFIDQDDIISPDYLKQMVAVAESSESDVVCAAIDAGNTIMPEPGEYDFARFIRGVHEPGGVDINIWGKLYRRSTIGTARCPVGIFGADDFVFTCRYFKERRRWLSVCPSAVYGYIMQPNNITSRMPAKFIIGTLEAEAVILDLLEGEAECSRREIARAASWGVKKVLRNRYSRGELRLIAERCGKIVRHPAFRFAKMKDRVRLRCAAVGWFGVSYAFYPSLLWKQRIIGRGRK